MANEIGISYTGSNTTYAQITRESDLYKYNVLDSIYETETITYANYAIVMTEVATDLVAADMPTSSAGWYVVQYREQSGGNPQNTDMLLRTDRIYWTGTVIAPVAPSVPSAPTLNTYAIVDVNQAKRFLNIDYDDVTKDAIITDLINIITGKLETFDRRIAAREYYEKVYTNGDTNITLSNWPVKYIKRIGMGEYQAFSVQNTGNYMRANISVSDSHDDPINSINEMFVVIQLTDQNGDENIYKIDCKTYKTITQIVNYINSNISGVSAAVIKDAPSKELWSQSPSDFTIGKMMISTTYVMQNTPYKIKYNIGTVNFSQPLPSWIMVEYYAGFESTDGEYYAAQSVVLECVKLMYDQIAKDWAAKSKSVDTGEAVNTASYWGALEMDKMIEYKFTAFKDFALGEL